MLQKIAIREIKERDGIAYFLEKNEMGEWEKGLIEGNWVEKNWLFRRENRDDLYFTFLLI